MHSLCASTQAEAQRLNGLVELISAILALICRCVRVRPRTVVEHAEAEGESEERVHMHSVREEYHLEIAQLVREGTEETVGLAARDRSETSVEDMYDRV